MTALGVSGLWNEINDPRSVYYNGKTYFGWVTTTGSIMVASYTHATGAVSTPFALSTVNSGEGTPDVDFVHMSVTLLVRSSDHRIVAVYNRQHHPCFRRISTNPEDATAWDASAAILTDYPTYLGYQYGSLCEVTGGTLYYVTHRQNASTSAVGICYATSADGGATWTGGTDLLQGPSGNLYWHAFAIGTKVHIFTTNTNRDVSFQSSVYHVYLDGSTLYTSNGTPIAGPYPASVSAGTMVLQGGPPLGSVRAESWGIDGTSPVVLLFSWDYSTAIENLVKVGRWNGSAWVVTAVAGTVGTVVNEFLSSATMVRNNPNVIYLPRKVGSVFELYRYTSTDSGATWTGVQLTYSSPSDNLRPDAPLNADLGLIALWPRGSFTNGSTFACDFQDLGTSYAVADHPSAWFTGTGKVGTPIGDGNRDVYVASDGVTLSASGVAYAAKRDEFAVRPPATGLDF